MKIKMNSSSVLCSIPAVPPCHPGPGVVVLLRPGDGGPACQAGVQGGEHAGEAVEEIRRWNWAIIDERESVHKSILPGLSTHSLSSGQARLSSPSPWAQLLQCGRVAGGQFTPCLHLGRLSFLLSVEQVRELPWLPFLLHQRRDILAQTPSNSARKEVSTVGPLPPPPEASHPCSISHTLKWRQVFTAGKHCWWPRSQTSFWHFKIYRKQELWSLSCGPLLPSSIDPAPDPN